MCRILAATRFFAKTNQTTNITTIRHNHRLYRVKTVMPVSLMPTQLKLAEILLTESTLTPKELAEEVGCSVSLLYCLRQNLNQFGTLRRPSFIPKRRPEVLTPAIRDVSVIGLHLLT